MSGMILLDNEAREQDKTRRMLADFDAHFEKHVVEGKIIELAKNCSFCAHYLAESKA